jgi:hypothetical protein
MDLVTHNNSLFNYTPIQVLLKKKIKGIKYHILSINIKINKDNFIENESNNCINQNSFYNNLINEIKEKYEIIDTDFCKNNISLKFNINLKNSKDKNNLIELNNKIKKNKKKYIFINKKFISINDFKIKIIKKSNDKGIEINNYINIYIHKKNYYLYNGLNNLINKKIKI